MGLVIALSGKRGCGKSTIAKLLAERLAEHGINASIFSFATVIKDRVARTYGIPPEWMIDRSLKEKPLSKADFPKISEDGITLRRLMQDMGRMLRRNDPAFTAHAIPKTEGVLIIDDLRMPAEDEALRKLGAFRVRIEAYEGYDVQDADVTEVALDDARDWDIVLRPAFGALPEACDELLPQILAKCKKAQDAASGQDPCA